MINNKTLNRHNELKYLSVYVYDTQNKKLPDGYKMLYDDYNPDNGFYGCVVRKENEVVVVYRGTEVQDKNDLKNDLQMIMNQYPFQERDAMRLYRSAENYCKNNHLNLTITGHSLGGSLREIVGTKTGAETVTFNAFGVRDILKDGEIEYEDNITNYCSKTDYAIARLKADKHIGKCYVVPTNTKTISHKLEYMGDLSKAQEISAKELLISTSIENKLKQTAKKIKNKISNCTGSYPVSGYVRSDGREVSSYTRSCYVHGN